MKKIFRYGLIAFLATGLALGGCKKKDEVEEDDAADQMQMAADESQETNESEASLNEANDAIFSTGLGKTGVVFGATIDSASIAEKKIIINYAGNNKDGSRSRSGQITVELTTGNKWRDMGSVITVTYSNFKVTRNNDQKSVTFNGSITIANVSGGRVWETANVIHRAAGSLTITFDDGTQREWNIARKRTFTNSGSIQTVITEGEGSQGGFNNLVTWGTTRKGSVFYTQITQPVVFSSTCPGKPISGIKTHKGIKREITVTFGTDSNGNAYTGTDCPYGAKIKWTSITGKEKTLVIQY